ncbi:hypothetical protein ACLOJK_021791 [Asimina triloba]
MDLRQLSHVQMVPLGHSARCKSPTVVDDGPKYTSLKDIIPRWPTKECQTYFHDAKSFGSLDIRIRNQLVKRAASAYLQSTAILVSPSRNFLQRLWRKITTQAVPWATWRVFMQACVDCLARRLSWFVACMANRIGR